MKTLTLGLAVVLVGIGFGQPAFSQEPTLEVASLNPQRIVIAPARTDLAATIREGLVTRLATARTGAAADEARQLYYFYGERYFEPIWLERSASGQVSFSDKAGAIIELFRTAGREGLRPEDYLTADLDPALAGADPARLAALETAFSAATLRYATHIHTGRIRPQDVSTLIDVQPKRIDETALLLELARSDDPAAVFARLEPQHPEFQALKAALARYDDVTASRPAPIADGALIRPGGIDPRLPAIRERLALVASLDPTVYDTMTLEAVKQFQRDAGLDPDGVIGPATIAALNGGLPTSRADILANMERWRWMPADLGSFNVVVNIPEFRLFINDGGRQTYTTRVVVGTVRNQTPVFSDNIRHIVVNPYWNVPNSIIRGEIAPAVLRNPGYLSGQNMELLYGGSVVSAASVNWGAVAASSSFPFRVRQRPGPGNALGQIKFLFPNKHDVYLHDTPSKALFSRDARAFSHGCVRVENPFEFAEALTAHEANISRASLEAMFGPSERWVNPDRQIPVHLTYFTVRVDQSGNLQSFGDLYGHNERLITLMGL
jgi:murein L,D-transpeptidase YcbB/YkuD